MYCYIPKRAIVFIVVLFIGACAQMPRHSNMMVFGTDSTVGLSIGNDAGQMPNIQFGYNRQEIALVPLLANTNVESGSKAKLLAPCPLPLEPSTGTVNEYKRHLEGCKFTATIDGINQDSYSVLASFGSKSKAGEGEGSVAIAQYFATGIAAQELARSGGANVVRAGGDADAIAKNLARSRVAEIAIEQKSAVSFCLDRIKTFVDDGGGKIDSDRLDQVRNKLGFGQMLPDLSGQEIANLQKRLSNPKYQSLLQNKQNCIVATTAEDNS